MTMDQQLLPPTPSTDPNVYLLYALGSLLLPIVLMWLKRRPPSPPKRRKQK
jgi:uncharacterized iron-regulated membrane protein